MFHGGTNPAFSRAIPHVVVGISLLLKVVITEARAAAVRAGVVAKPSEG